MNIGYQRVGQWYAIRKVEFFPFDVYLVNDGYVRGANSALRWRFKNTFFYYENGFEHSFRGAEDMHELQQFLQRNFDGHFVERVGNEIRVAADDLLMITEKTFTRRTNLQRHFNDWCEAMRAFFAIFQTPELAQMLTSGKDARFLYQFGLARDYAARKLANAEHIYRSRLGVLLGISVRDVLMLLPEEAQGAISKNIFPKNFKQRKTCALLTINRKIRVHWNRAADALFVREILWHQKVKQGNKLVGQGAYKGKVRGKAYIALNAEDFKKIPRGAILVCSMTRYTVVPYLKRVSAIITDQGGITCHAAIMARELKVPTVIGTQRATDILKTGDRVEVDAVKGIVRKI